MFMSDAEKMQEYNNKRTGAEQGDAKSQFELGMIYYLAEIVKRDKILALKWFSIAAQQGHGRAVELKTEIKTAMTSTQIAESEKFAREWFESHPKIIT